MRIQSSRDLGAAIRATRRVLGIGQTDLATLAGVSRQWIVALEGGKPGAEIGLVLRTLKALDLPLWVGELPGPPSSDQGSDVDIDAIVTAARGAP